MLKVKGTVRRRGAAVVIPALLGTLLVPAAGLGATPAFAAPGDGTLNVTLAQKTGTPDFDADDAPGNDSSADNDIVRTNDTVTYTVGVRYEGEDQTNPAISFTLPQGEELVQLPPFCLAGSSVTPESIGTPVIPVTGTSYQSLPTQTVVCVVADQKQGTSLDYDFVSKVRPEVPNGVTLDPMTASATSTQVTEPAVSNAVEHTVSAVANFDVSKRGAAVPENAGPYTQDPLQACSFDASRLCRPVYYPLTVNAPPGGKGITPLASPITLTDDMTPASFFGATVWAQAVALAGSESAALEKYAPRFGACQDVSYATWTQLPWSRSNPPNVDSASDSGVIDCQQPGGLGAPVSITITDADTTGYHYPTELPGSSGTPPADVAYVVIYEIKMEIPQDAVTELGTVGADGVTKTLATENTYEDVVMTDIAGNPNTGEVVENNNRTAVLSMRGGSGAAGEHFDKFFSSPWGKKGNTDTWTFSRGYWEGPPGSSAVRDGNTVVLPGQVVLSNLIMESTGGVPLSDTQFSRSYLACDVWDDTQLGLTPGAYASPDQPYIRPSNGDAAWVSYFRNGNGDRAPLSELRNLKIEYSSGPAGAGADSDCSTGTWYDNPAAVPGATLDAEGVYSGVNRVRVSYSSDFVGLPDSFVVHLTIGQTVRDTAGDQGDVIGNWGSRKWVEGLTDGDGVIADPKAYDTSSYDPATHQSSWGDRLTIGGVSARIKKYVKHPGTGDFTDTAVPQYTAGSQVDYRLNPTLTADVPAGVMAEAIVEDCLPEYQQFVSSVRANGDPITPALVQAGAPAGSELACPANQTYVKWDLGSLVVNDPIDPIIYTVDILETARNATYTNVTLISSPQDPSLASARDDEAQIQLVLPTGIKIAKSTPRPLVEINPDGVQTPRTLTWTVDFANIDSPVDVSDVDVIDVLPANGVGTTNFTGDLTFTSATVAAGTGITMLYTAAAPASLNADPDDASNGATGATVWCDAITGGNVVSGNGTASDCPTAPADVTGLRFLRPGAFAPADQLSVDIVMTPTNNDGGDVYENTTAGRAQGVTQPVGPASREIAIIESSVGDFVWEDLNADGIQDAGEPGVAGFPVTLVGVDLDGNPVSLSTTTDADGKYSFTGLASGTYKVTFDPNALASNTTFTQQNIGSDDALDSDGDTTTGETAEFALAPNSDDPNWDQGLIIDRNVDITVDKKLVEQTELDEDNRATVTYEIVVANAGTAEGTYDLDDQLTFGGDIEIDKVTASNTAPGDIVIDPAFDGIDNRILVAGQTIAGGETHTYEVVVETTVATTITAEQGDCELTESERGTGFLNEARLTVDGATVTDTACGEVPPEDPKDPPTEPETPAAASDDDLAHTGGSLATGAVLLAVLALMAGAALLLRRRRHVEAMPED
ncbi:hypothetical protein GCM10027416_19390 [Okibacterium endophyticum]